MRATSNWLFFTIFYFYPIFFFIERFYTTFEPNLLMAEFQTPKGMKDYSGADALLRERMLETIRTVYSRWGYEPLTTPAIEMRGTLGAKAGDEIEGQLFKIEESEYALRFDLTVGTARFAANSNMPKPYKRYCIAPVWRREEPQKGRLREFLQADADVIGSADMRCEAELLAMAGSALSALGFEKFEVLLNNRKILNGLLKKLKIEKKEGAVLRALDKLDKVGEKKVVLELESAGIGKKEISELIDWINFDGTNEEKLERAKEYSKEGAKELEDILCVLKFAYAISDVKIDLSLVRGLGYYTGPIFEIKAGKEIGSIAGGGRYDNLLSLYGKDEPAVGISLGIERIFALQKDAGEKLGNCDVVVVTADNESYGAGISLASKLREKGISAMSDLNDRKFGAQLKYASSIGAKFAIIIGKKEIESGKFTLKNLGSGEQKEIGLGEIEKEILSG